MGYDEKQCRTCRYSVEGERLMCANPQNNLGEPVWFFMVRRYLGDRDCGRVAKSEMVSPL